MAFQDCTHVVLTFDDSHADTLGRRAFTITWRQPLGAWRPELAKDGQAVGYRRGQCYHADANVWAARIRAAGGRVIDPVRDLAA